MSLPSTQGIPNYFMIFEYFNSPLLGCNWKMYPSSLPGTKYTHTLAQGSQELGTSSEAPAFPPHQRRPSLSCPNAAQSEVSVHLAATISVVLVVEKHLLCFPFSLKWMEILGIIFNICLQTFLNINQVNLIQDVLFKNIALTLWFLK